MAPTDSMDVELPETKLVKIKADDDPESEGAFMRLSLLRFRMTRCVPPCRRRSACDENIAR